jgi:hypothetical protein
MPVQPRNDCALFNVPKNDLRVVANRREDFIALVYHPPPPPTSVRRLERNVVDLSGVAAEGCHALAVGEVKHVAI